MIPVPRENHGSLHADHIDHRGLWRGLACYSWAFLAVGLSIGAWSVSTPLGAAPDEPAHVVEAAAAVRGQFDAPRQEITIYGIALGQAGYVVVPKWVANIYNEPGCFLHRPEVPASCSPPVGSDTRSVISTSQFTNYPPLYYLIVGLPTLLSVGSGALHAMQYTGALLDAALIALGLYLLARYHPRRLPLLGALIALTPMVLFMSGVVNSSGLEIAAAFATWCGGLCVAVRSEVPWGLAVLTALSLVLLILSRPISPVNATVMVVVLAAFVGWGRTRALLGKRSLRAIWISALFATMTAGVYILVVGLPSLDGVHKGRPLSAAGAVLLTLRLTGNRLRQCVGDFGWLDTPAPVWVIVVWAVVVAGLLIYALAVSPRARRALPLLAFAILVMPVVFESPQINAVGNYWQGRYWLPLAIGLPLVASSVRPQAIYRSARSAVGACPPFRLAGFAVVGGLLGAAQLAAFLTALRRYETGLGAKAGALVKWKPPGGSALVITLFAVGQILMLGFLAKEYAHRSTP
jgi:Predicted membrane protein (DUF2142)